MSIAPDVQFGLALDPAQGRLLMAALGERPFRTVYALIGRLNVWALAAFPVDPGPHDAPGFPFTLTRAELELALDALGDLPHRRVHRLVASLQAQLQELQALQGGSAHG